jgi:hypothetical protein
MGPVSSVKGLRPVGGGWESWWGFVGSGGVAEVWEEGVEVLEGGDAPSRFGAGRIGTGLVCRGCCVFSGVVIEFKEAGDGSRPVMAPLASNMIDCSVW